MTTKQIIGFIFYAIAIGVFVRGYLIPTIRRKNQAPRNVSYALSKAQNVEGIENLKRIQAVLIALQLTVIGVILTV